MPTHILAQEGRLDWLRLSLSENVGPQTFRALLDRYGSAEAALAALPDLAKRGGRARPIRICSREEARLVLERAHRCDARFVVPGEAGYPPLLRSVEGVPPLLCVKGSDEVLSRPAIAIVGARNASALGRTFARQIAVELSQAGFTVVSGLARGIDAAAHEASLAGGTAAVLAGGVDIIYPPEHAGLQAEIGKRGALVTEMMPGTQPRAEHFPRRNRIISGMSLAVVVVEAALRSGSLITARFAAEQGREVFAVPGFPLDPRAGGTNKLIRDGATLTTSARDILDVVSRQIELPPTSDEVLQSADGFDASCLPGPIDGDSQAAILSLLGPSPVAIDTLARESGLPVQEVLGVLLELELAGRLLRHGQQNVSLAVLELTADRPI